jgi:hypothetical protein
VCVFCAAIPVAAAGGASLHNKQLQARRKAEATGTEKPPTRPVVRVTAGVVVLLLVGSITYHTLTSFPY